MSEQTSHKQGQSKPSFNLRFMTEPTTSRYQFGSLDRLRERLDALLPHINLADLASTKRGIERETLRMDTTGQISLDAHSREWGSKLTHPYITTDYAEAQPEMVTGVHETRASLIDELHHIHYEMQRVMAENNEVMWPFSMPPATEAAHPPAFADFGTSVTGRLKSLYRFGLQTRYGTSMQLITGTHYNFSFSEQWWQNWAKAQEPNDDLQHHIDEGYLALARNFSRRVWVMHWLFGASPIAPDSHLQQYKGPPSQQESVVAGDHYKDSATSLRNSRYGYSSPWQSQDLLCLYDTTHHYIALMLRGMSTEVAEFTDDSHYLKQINNCLLQIPNEFYQPIRLKSKMELPLLDGLSKHGISYIEVRAPDINPASCCGIDEDMACCMDLLLILCLVDESPDLSEQEVRALQIYREQVALYGRSQDDCRIRAERILEKLQYLATAISEATGQDWSSGLKILEDRVSNPTQHLPSAVLARQIAEAGSYTELGMKIARENSEYLLQSFEVDYKQLADIQWHHSQSRKSEGYYKQVSDTDFVSLLENTPANLRWNLPDLANDNS